MPFFRYDSEAKVIVFAWVNDENTLRSAGGKSDPYAVFQKMPGRGRPPIRVYFNLIHKGWHRPYRDDAAV